MTPEIAFYVQVAGVSGKLKVDGDINVAMTDGEGSTLDHLELDKAAADLTKQKMDEVLARAGNGATEVILTINADAKGKVLQDGKVAHSGFQTRPIPTSLITTR